MWGARQAGHPITVPSAVTLIGSRSRPASGENVDEQEHDCNDEQRVNERPTDVEQKAEQPEHDQQRDDSPK
jgi:hypothetical protein